MSANKGRVPGPMRWSPFGSLAELRRDPLTTLLDARQTYGDVARLRIGAWFAYLIAHPDDVRHVLQDNYQSYRKSFTFGFLKPVLGFGLLTNEGDSWLSQRRLAQPAFHHDRVVEFADVITSSVEAMLDRRRRSPNPTTIDVVQEMSALTMTIVSRALLGSGFDADTTRVSEAVRIAQEHVNWQILHLFTASDRFPTRRNRRFKHALEVLNSIVFTIIEEKRNAGERGNDLLTLLLEARDEDTGEGMTDLQLRDEVMTIFLAGHETTANALAWTWHLLSLNPEAEERLHDELDHVLGDRVPCLADLPRLEYTRRVFDEALRLRPPVWAIGRFPLRHDVASGYRIPAHSSVILSPYVTHRHPEFWPDPERFDPDRFLPEAVAARPRYAYFPFGGGPRMCIGSEFAMLEGVLALAAIAREFRLAAVPNHRVELEPLITLRPKGGLPMVLERR